MADEPPGDATDATDATDAASFIRRHAGAHEPGLTSEQRDLLGRVIARRLARGEKIELIARAVAGALPELDADRARRLGRDETLRARAWEDLAHLRADGVTAVIISAARDCCPACRAAADLTPLTPFPTREGGAGAGDSGAGGAGASGAGDSGAVASGSPLRVGEGRGERSTLPTIPIAGCTHPAGCRCRYVAADLTPQPPSQRGKGEPETAPAPESASPLRVGEEPGERSTRPWYRPRPPRPHGPRWTEEERAARRRDARPPARKPIRKRPPR